MTVTLYSRPSESICNTRWPAWDPERSPEHRRRFCSVYASDPTVRKTRILEKDILRTRYVGMLFFEDFAGLELEVVVHSMWDLNLMAEVRGGCIQILKQEQIRSTRSRRKRSAN